MKNKWIYLITWITGAVLVGCAPKETHQILTIQNTADIDLTSKPIRVDHASLRAEADKPYPILVNEVGDTVPLQVSDLDQDGSWDELFFVMDLKAESTRKLEIQWAETPVLFEKKTSIRFGKQDAAGGPVYAKTIDTLYGNNVVGRLGYQPYQTDGPTIENDKVGYRHYFDGRIAKDYFGKKVTTISPESVGIGDDGSVEDTYHVMNDWGRDVLGVGNSAGLGGIELMIGDQFVRIGCIATDSVTNVASSSFEILEEGAVKSMMVLGQQDWVPLENRRYQVQEKVSIWPGTYAYHNEVQFEGLQGDETLLIGLVNSNTDKELSILDQVSDDFVALYTYDKQTYDKTWDLGMAIILPKSLYLGSGEAPKTGAFSNSYFGKLRLSGTTPVEYYALGGWELSLDDFKSEAAFVAYVTDFLRQLSAEVLISVH